MDSVNKGTGLDWNLELVGCKINREKDILLWCRKESIMKSRKLYSNPGLH